MSAPSAPIEVFYSYAHEDERLRKKLETHLSLLQQQGLISTWHNRKISAGTEWISEVSAYLNTAQIILLLVSPSFLSSKYCYGSEMMRALERHEDGTARVIPIILRPVYWKDAPFSKLQVLPTDARPVTSRRWRSLDEAFTDVVQGIYRVIEEIRSKNRNIHRITQISTVSDESTPTIVSVAIDIESTRSQNLFESKLDWGDAPNIHALFGRDGEIKKAENWISRAECKVLAILGIGGIGKSSLAVKIVTNLQAQFEYVFWRSLGNALQPQEFFSKCIQVISGYRLTGSLGSIDEQITILLEYMQKSPCLVVLDNLEAVMEGGDRAGRYRRGYEGYGLFIQRLGETSHISCLIATSREKPKEIALLEGSTAPVRSIRLAGLEVQDIQHMLESVREVREHFKLMHI